MSNKRLGLVVCGCIAAGLLLIVLAWRLLAPDRGVDDNAAAGLPRGLVLQEGGAEAAAALGVRIAAKRWPAAYGTAYIDRELATAAGLGVQLMVGWTWQNETYTGAPSALPPSWPKLCWGGEQPGCGPNYADPVAREAALQSIRELGRYDGHPQVAGIMANVGDDGERRFCKHPVSGDPCFEAYRAAGLDSRIWQQFVADVARTYAETFKRTPVLFHYSGLGFHPGEIGRDAGAAVSAGLGLMSSGLYPVMCSGNSYGGACNPAEPLLSDWQIPGKYPSAPLAMEQSLGYGDGQAALAWLWAVTHGAEQIHAQKATLQASLGTSFRETAEYMLANPQAALWVAMEPGASICSTVGRPLYCPEMGDWSRNVISATAGAIVYNAGSSYMGWAARAMPILLRTTVTGPATVIAWKADGTGATWQQESGELIALSGTAYIHRIEVRPNAAAPDATVTPRPTWTGTASPAVTGTASPVPTGTASPAVTGTAVPTATAEPSATPTAKATPTFTLTPTATAAQRRWHVTGTIGDHQVDLWIEGY